MKLKYIASLIALSLISTSAMAKLKANDDTNQMEGTNGETMMRSNDNGKTWFHFETTKDGESYGLNNNFPGTQTVIVANEMYPVMNTPAWDASQTYSKPDNKVRYDGYFWTNQWWAGPEQVPGVDDVWKKGEPTNLQSNILGTFYFTPWTGEKAEQFQAESKAQVASQRKIIGYFPEWGVYDAHNNFTPDKINMSNLTHVNYGFAVIKNGIVEMHDAEKAPQLIPELVGRTSTQGRRLMISFGGWDNSQEGAFEAATATSAGTEKLAQSMVDYMLKWHFDGIDVDWEYPDNEQEKAQFTQLIQLLRSKLDSVGLQNDKYFQLSAAVTTSYKNMEFINPTVTTPLLDSVNVMAYDIHGAFDPITGHNAPLFANSKDTDTKLNDAYAMKEYNQTYGVPKSKLMMGLAFYGRAWGEVEPTIIVPGLPGLFAPGNATVKGAWDDVGQTTGTNPYYLLKDWAKNPAFTRYYDTEARVPYLYNAQTKEFFTYDDEQSIREKVDYIQSEGFGGAIIWDLSGDTPDYDLGNIAKDILYSNVKENDVTRFVIEMKGAIPVVRADINKDYNSHYIFKKNDKYFGELFTNGSSPYMSQGNTDESIILRSDTVKPKAGDELTITMEDEDHVLSTVKTLVVTDEMLVQEQSITTDPNFLSMNVDSDKLLVSISKDFTDHYILQSNGNYIGELYTNKTSPYLYRQDTADAIVLKHNLTTAEKAPGTKFTVLREDKVAGQFVIVGETVTP